MAPTFRAVHKTAAAAWDPFDRALRRFHKAFVIVSLTKETLSGRPLTYPWLSLRVRMLF